MPRVWPHGVIQEGKKRRFFFCRRNEAKCRCPIYNLVIHGGILRPKMGVTRGYTRGITVTCSMAPEWDVLPAGFSGVAKLHAKKDTVSVMGLFFQTQTSPCVNLCFC